MTMEVYSELFRVNSVAFRTLSPVHKRETTKVTSSYHLCVECFSQLSFDSEVYTKSATAAD